MAEDTFDDKTEPATPKKIARAREEGRVLKSREINTTVMIGSSVIILAIWIPIFLRRWTALAWHIHGNAGAIAVTPDTVYGQFIVGLQWFMALLLPVMIPLVVAAYLTNVFQVGFIFSTKPMNLKLNALNPITGIKRLFSPSGLSELVKSFLKLGIVGAVAFFTIRSRFDELVTLTGASTGVFLSTLGKAAVTLGIRVTVALLILSLFDYLFQRWQFLRSLRMTKKEVSDEMKQSEGDPHIKGRVRGLMREMSRQRMLSDTATADVVVTNPVHVAVALKYDPMASPAPIVVAKGMRLVAARIKEIAAENDVPIVENPPLARQLHKLVEVGDAIPDSLYRAVAEILAFVYRLRGQAAG